MNTPLHPNNKAFTLLELLVVVAIIAIGATLVLPGVTRIIQSTNYTSALNTVTAALGNARAQAIRTGRPTGVVFLFDIENQITTLQVVEASGFQSGVLTDLPTSDLRHTYCEIFTPALGSAPIRLPEGVGVLGLSFFLAPATGTGSYIDSDETTAHWYAGEQLAAGSGDPAQIPWVFPRNDPRHFFNNDSLELLWDSNLRAATSAVRHANTFIVRFDANGAIINTSDSGGVRTANAYLEFTDAPIQLGDPDRETQDEALVFDPETGLGDGNSPNPELVLRSAQQLAIVDLNRLREATGIAAPWLVRSESALAPRGNGDPDNDKVRQISRWVDNNAEIFAFNRYTGEKLRRER